MTELLSVFVLPVVASSFAPLPFTCFTGTMTHADLFSEVCDDVTTFRVSKRMFNKQVCSVCMLLRLNAPA